MFKEKSTLFYFMLMLSLLFSCGGKTEEAEGKEDSSSISLTQKQIENSHIQLGNAGRNRMSSQVTANGLVDVPPQYKAVISTPVGGFVKTTEVLEGDHVHKGEVLSVLTHQEYVHLQQQFLEAKSRYVLAEKQLSRQKELRDENINSQKKLEETEADLKIALAQMKALEANLKMIGLNPDKISEGNISSTIEIRSPISGDVSMVNISLGKFTKPEEVMFEVISEEHLHLDLKVYEKDVLKIKEGQRITYTLAQDSGQRVAKVILVGKKLDPVSRTVSVHAHPENSEGLLPGMYVTATIFSDEKMVTTLPEEALVKEGDKNYIFIKSGEKNGSWFFTKLLIEAGNASNGITEIKSPALDSYQGNIVLKGAYYINAHSSMMNSEEE